MPESETVTNEVELEKVAHSVFGISSRRYRQLANDEVVPAVVKGKIDFVAASKGLIEYYRRLAEADGSLVLRDEQAALTAIKKEREKLKLETDRKNLVPRSQAIEWLSAILSEVKLAFVGLPRRLAGSLVILQDEREIESVLRSEVMKILWTLAKPLEGRKKGKK